MRIFFLNNIYKFKSKLILLFALFLFISTINAQKYNFRNFSVNEGISQSEIYAVCEDKRGNLWFGSLGGGIMKYDGYTFAPYTEENGLINNFVLSICEDNSGLLWIGTEEGVCTYDGYSFRHIDMETGPGNVAVKTIIQDSKNNIWLGTEEKGLYRFNGNTFKHFLSETDMPDITVYCLIEDKKNNIWIGTEGGVYKFKDRKFTHYNNKNGLGSNIIRGISEDSNGNIWFATYTGGVYCYDGENFKNYTVQDGLAHSTVFSTFCDKKGNIWFGTADGISKYNGISFKTYTESNGATSNMVICIYEDTSHNLWFGTSGGGISKLDNERFIHYPENEKLGRRVYSCVQISNGNMVFGTSTGGMTVFDGKNYTLLKGNDFFTQSEVRTLYYTPDSILWIGTLDDEVHKYDIGFFHYSSDEGFNNNKISGFAVDTKGNTWVSSLENGLSVLLKDSVNFISLNEIAIIDSLNVFSIAADSTGNIWAGSDNKGLYKISLSKNITSAPEIINFGIKDGLTEHSVRSIVIDTADNVYCGTAGGGICIYNEKEFKTITTNEGLFSNNIYSLIFDNQYNLWAGSESGLDRITFNKDLSVSEIRHYGRNEGFAGVEIYRNSCCKDNKGNLWFGTVNGVTMYNPEEDIPCKIQSKTHLTGIKLFYSNIEDTKYADSISAWYPVPTELTLPHNQNNLTFEFTGIYHRNPEAVRYKIMMEGIDEGWSPAINQRNQTYSFIPPGEYTFKVISCNEYGVWNIEPAVFKFKILYPVWQKWWFVVIIIGFFVILISAFIFSRFKRIKRKNEIEKERLETEKSIIELEQQAARLQMNPHFIFNSLNSIQGFIATNDAFQAKKYLAKFARLMRLILENAREEYIPLENETDILRNYLELEKLSTNNKFDFNINIDESINPEIIEIPPMMIQPFVENAIIHGIKKKSDKGLIEINFSKNDNLIICDIIDNGIGRQLSGKHKPQTKHKSTGISVTKKRLEQLKIQTGTDAGIEIIDLKDKNNNPKGTKVVISIPFESY